MACCIHAYNQPDALLSKEWRAACRAVSRAECLFSQNHRLLFYYFSSIIFLFLNLSQKCYVWIMQKKKTFDCKGLFFSISDLVGQFQYRLNKHCFPAEALLGHSSPREHSIGDSRGWHAPCPEAALSDLGEPGVLPPPTWLLASHQRSKELLPETFSTAADVWVMGSWDGDTTSSTPEECASIHVYAHIQFCICWGSQVENQSNVLHNKISCSGFYGSAIVLTSFSMTTITIDSLAVMLSTAL